MSDGLYATLTKNLNYRIITFIPPIFGILLLVVVFFNGIQFGIDFKGGMWMDALTDRDIDSSQLRQLEVDLEAKGLRDVKAHVGYDVDTGHNKLVIQTTSVVDDTTPILEEITGYTGKLTEFDTAKLNLADRPPVELKENLEKRLKMGVDLNWDDGVLTVVALDLNKEDIVSALSYYLGDAVEVDFAKKNFNIRSVGPTFGKTFRDQGFKALFVSMILMSIVVLFAFREFIPCVAVIQAAIFDILIALGGMSVLGIPLEPASLAALLMLIGYSVDTDIMLTSRVLKERGSEFLEQVEDAFKTGLTMTGTTLAALTVIYIISTTLTQVHVWASISSVLIIGLLGDLATTWMTNVGILRWYTEVPSRRKLFSFGGRR